MRQRQVMALTYDGFTPAEIAVILGISAQAVSSSAYQARARIRHMIDAEGGVDVQ